MFLLYKKMFSGSIVALVTPFSKKNEVDYDALEKIINWQIDSGSEGILVCGSTGEGLLLSESERIEIIKKSIRFSNKRIPVIVGCSSCSTVDAIQLVRQAEELGADGVLVTASYYIKPTQLGIIEHFKDVHDNTNIPMIIYNIPGRCSVSISIETIAELSRLPRIVALKDSDTNLARVTSIKSKAPDLVLLSGDDPTLPGFLAHGGSGAISATANVAPKLVRQLIESWKIRDIDLFQEISRKLSPLNEALGLESNPIPAKYALSKKGFIENVLRPPLTSASKTTMEKIDEILKGY